MDFVDNSVPTNEHLLQILTHNLNSLKIHVGANQQNKIPACEALKIDNEYQL